jgi:hypothetical protein
VSGIQCYTLTIDNQCALQMSTSSTKRKLEAPEEDSLSRKRIPLNLDSGSLADNANSDSGVSRVQLEEQVWMVQWYNLIDL